MIPSNLDSIFGGFLVGLVSWISATGWMLVAALVLDRLLGEPKSWHPLVWFGRWVDLCRQYGQLPLDASASRQRLAGVLAWCLAVMPWVLILFVLLWVLPTFLDNILTVLVLYFAIGWQSLREHALAIYQPLSSMPLTNEKLDEARLAVSYIVSRDTQNLDESAVAKAGIESVLENGSDAIFAPIFWFLLLGAPGVLLYRLANTLDAMWGYKDSRFLSFGWAAARIDDVLNYLPARLTALSYALAGKTRIALLCWQAQAVTWKSPNAGPVMAAGAGAINVSLGGAAIYHGELQQRPQLGPDRDSGDTPSAQGIERACTLVNRALCIWVLFIVVMTGVLAWL